MKNVILKFSLMLSMLLGSSLAFASDHGDSVTTDLSGMYGAANFMSWVVLTVVPIVGLYLFWLVHIYPEKVAHERNHPQADAIKMLCIVSLFFGGAFWPIALIWAYMKPFKFRFSNNKEILMEEPAKAVEAEQVTS